jgi:hypothetical protein
MSKTPVDDPSPGRCLARPTGSFGLTGRAWLTSDRTDFTHPVVSPTPDQDDYVSVENIRLSYVLACRETWR